MGGWKNIQDLEDNISLDELYALYKATRDKEYRHHRFMAALKGVNLDEDEKDDFENVKRRAEARLKGRSEESIELEEFGLDIIEEE